MIDFAAAGLGLEHGTVSLAPVLASWTPIAVELASDIRGALGDLVDDVQHVGSTACTGLLAKPIVDLAFGVRPGIQVDDVTGRLSEIGWLYRGDAGDEGGWIYVLEDRPLHRVAHAHGVEAGGAQWRRYLEFRELLKVSARAREAYQEVKVELAHLFSRDAPRYTAGKDATVKLLLSGGA